jgi:hypothetical protein
LEFPVDYQIYQSGGDLNEISAGVFKYSDGRSCRLGWFLGKCHAVLLESLVFLLDVCDEEIGRGNPLPMDLLLIGPGRGVLVKFEDQLHAFWFFRGDDGEPSVFPSREIHFLNEAQNVGVKLQRLVLIVNENTS